MRKNIVYSIGDKVFAKMKGYPAWPAKVVSKRSKTYGVQFYGTGEMGFVKPENLFFYLQYKHRFIKSLKRKDFNDAVNEIENELRNEGQDINDVNINNEQQSTDNSISDVSELGKRKRTSSDASEETTDSLQNDKKGRLDFSDETLKTVPEDTETSQLVPEAQPDLNTEKPPENTPNEPTITKANVDFISEDYLKSIIAYMEHVQKNTDNYKSKSVETRNTSPYSVLPIRLSSGIYTGLKLYTKWPLEYTNEHDLAIYEGEMAMNLLDMKKRIENNEEDLINNSEFISNVNFDEKSVFDQLERKTIENKTRITNQLRNESKILELDVDIRSSLGLKQADPKKALNLLDRLMNECDLNEFTLKKHSHVVEMVRRLRKYVGNVEDWKLNEIELKEFQNDAEIIRKKAELFYEKIKQTIKLSENVTNFWEGFTAIVNEFKEKCKDWNDHEKFTLCTEPGSRQAFLDMLENRDFEELEVASKDTEKENSSEIANLEDTKNDETF